MSGRTCGFLAVFAISIVSHIPAARAAEPLDFVPEAYRAELAERLKPAEGEAGAKRRAWAEALKAQPEERRDSFAFLLANMPDDDFEKLSPDFLARNVELAHEARKATPWAAAVPLELFREQVLPYASVNERRDDWRKDFMDRFLPMVRDLKSVDEAVKKLNVEVFKTFGVAYHPTKRPKPDQSPYESIEAKFASCTGLSILLIDACRAVGIPARFVGVPQWTNVKGNHSWVEVFTNHWQFVGACEPSKLDETWFIGNASKADETDPMKKVYATSFRKTGTHFPLIWNRSAKWVQAEDVTRFYTTRDKITIEPGPGDNGKVLEFRHQGRLVARVPMDAKTEVNLPTGLPLRWILKSSDGKTIEERDVNYQESGKRSWISAEAS